MVHALDQLLRSRKFGACIANCRLTKFPLKYTQLFTGLQVVYTVNGLKLKKNCLPKKADAAKCSPESGKGAKSSYRKRDCGNIRTIKPLAFFMRAIIMGERASEVHDLTARVPMKTDSFFYRFFLEFPEAFFALIGQRKWKGQGYKFTSVEVKDIDFRFDGVFVPSAKDALLYFVEAQFTKKRIFYPNFFAKIMVHPTKAYLVSC
ncbi:MAG: DUF2887 domain-containing protein, partial [candidate division KSB1 bacterium]